MSYRTYINNVQVFGNNEYYDEWLEFIKYQGIHIDADGCYKGEIKDFMAALSVVESIVLRLNKEREELKEKWNGKIGNKPIMSFFDFTNIPNSLAKQPDDDYKTSLFDALYDTVHETYAFMPYTFFLACQSQLDGDNLYDFKGHAICFKLKDGETIKVEAH